MYKNLLLLTLLAAVHGSALDSKPVVEAAAVSNIDEEPIQKAFHVSPQDQNYERKVDTDDKYHAPSTAPNDKQSEDDVTTESPSKGSDIEQTTREDGEKGSKGAVILADYDSNRLGVSADEAKNGAAQKENKKPKLGSVTAPKGGKVKQKAKDETDAANAVEYNKAQGKPSKPSKDEEREAKEATQHALNEKEDEREVRKLMELEDAHEDPKVKQQKAKEWVNDSEAKEDRKEADMLLKQEKQYEKSVPAKSSVAAMTSHLSSIKPSKASSTVSKEGVSTVKTTDTVTQTGITKTDYVTGSTGSVAAASNTVTSLLKDVVKATTTTSVSTEVTTAAKAIYTAETKADKDLKDLKDLKAEKVAESPKETKTEAKTDLKTESKTGPTAEDLEAEEYKAIAESGYMGRLLGSAVMIVVSEIGDKTFFIAALMAMRHNQWFVFSSSFSAMFVMTVLSMCLGLVLPTLLSRRVTTLLAAALFFVFAAKMFREALGMDAKLLATEEMEEVEQDLAENSEEKLPRPAAAANAKGSKSALNGLRNLANLVFSPVWIQIFMMTFLGEWGDRSQIATVAMGAGEGFFSVLVGCLAGHFITTLIAVLGGKILAKKLSLRTITLGGGSCFVLFGFINLADWLSQA